MPGEVITIEPTIDVEELLELVADGFDASQTILGCLNKGEVGSAGFWVNDLEEVLLKIQQGLARVSDG